jgi:CelD/BcsL family acetyltransferase involved in cellulose biosynthesis
LEAVEQQAVRGAAAGGQAAGQAAALTAGQVSEPAPAPPMGAELASTLPAGPRVVVLERVADLEAYRSSWQALAERTVEPNVFYQPSLLLPALRAFGGSADLALVLVLGEPPESARRADPPELLGLFPLERRLAANDWPVSYLRLWTGDYSYVPVPLLRQGRAAEALGAFFDWLESQRRAAPLLEMERLPLGGPFHGLLIDELARRQAHVHVKHSYTRALYEPDGPIEEYLQRVLPAKDRRELQRQRKRLQELGKSEIVSIGPHDDVAAWAEEFLALEANGWKGRHGTAFVSRENDAQFFREMFPAALAAGDLSSTALRLDGRALAMQILLHAGSGAYGYKTCYDEEYARYAPGLQLEIDLMERAASGISAAAPNGRPTPATRPLRWIDSAAVSDHPLFNRIYGERRPVETWLVTPDRTLGLFLSLVPLTRWLRRTFRALTGRA